MNSERLMSMIRQVHLEMTRLEIRTKMEQLQNHLQSAINSPNENTQRAVEYLKSYIVTICAARPAPLGASPNPTLRSGFANRRAVR